MVLIYIEAHTIQFYETKSCGTIGVLAFPLLLPIISKLYRAIGGENVQLYCQSRFVIMFSMMGETFSWAATTRAGNGCATGAAADSVPQPPLMQQEWAVEISHSYRQPDRGKPGSWKRRASIASYHTDGHKNLSFRICFWSIFILSP